MRTERMMKQRKHEAFDYLMVLKNPSMFVRCHTSPSKPRGKGALAHFAIASEGRIGEKSPAFPAEMDRKYVRCNTGSDPRHHRGCDRVPSRFLDRPPPACGTCLRPRRGRLLGFVYGPDPARRD